MNYSFHGMETVFSYYTKYEKILIVDSFHDAAIIILRFTLFIQCYFNHGQL